MVETEDGLFPLNQLAQIVQKNPTLLIVNLVAMPQVKNSSSFHSFQGQGKTSQ